MIWQTSSISSSDTESLGECLGKLLRGGEFIELISDVGGGKTTFVRGLVKGASSKDRVSSPTFTISKIYKSDKLNINHFDLYRLSEPGLVREALQEQIGATNSVVLVEWSAILDDVLPEDRLKIELKTVSADPNERQINIHYPERYANYIMKIQQERGVLKA